MASCPEKGTSEEPQERDPEPGMGERRDGFELVDCQKVLQAAAAKLKNIFEQNKVVLTSGPLPQVLGDGYQLIDLFEQLLTYALSSSPASPRLHVAARPSGEEWLIALGTAGLGLDSQALGTVLETGELGQSLAGNTGAASRLGRCKGIVERHGGQLWAVSTLSGIPTFYFTLPMVKPESLPAMLFRLGQKPPGNEAGLGKDTPG